MVAPSATPITLPDQAQRGQGSMRKQTTASQTIEKAFFIASQPSRFNAYQYEIQFARAVPSIPIGIRLAWMVVKNCTGFLAF